MSFAPQTLLDARAYLRPRTGLSDASLGIVGSTGHTFGYHLGRDRLATDDYSARTARDRAGLTDAAAALDVGSFPRLRELTAHMVAEARAGRLSDVRELIGPGSDGRAYRWDHLAGWSPVRRAAGDSHEWHLHISYYRDSERRSKLAPFQHFFEGDDMPTAKEFVDELLDRLVPTAGLADDTLPPAWGRKVHQLLAYAAMTSAPPSRARFAADTWEHPAAAEVRAGLAALLAAHAGGDAVAAVEQAVAGLTARLDAADTQRAELLALVRQVAAGEADAAAVVDEIGRRLGSGTDL
jgi:hypothetical protein